MLRNARIATATIVASLACALVLAGPAGAATASFGSVTATSPSMSSCSGVVCMKASGTFTFTTSSPSAVVTLNVRIMRIASGTTKTSSDAVVTNQSVSFGTTKGMSLTRTLSVAQNCRTTGSFSFYTRATISNGSTTAVQDSAVVKLTGCASV